MRSHKKKTAANELPIQIFLSRQPSRVVNQMPDPQLSRTPSVMPVLDDLEPFTGFRQIQVTLLINNKKYDMGLLSCKVQDEELLIGDLIHQLKLQKNEGSEFIDKSLVSIQDSDETKLMQMPVYIFIGQDPLHKDCRFNLQGDSIEIKIQSAYRGLLDQVLEGSTPDKTQKQRCLSEVVERVALWRRLYSGFYDQNRTFVQMSLDSAAKKVDISKKTLDDYLLQIRYGKRFGFDFNKNKSDGISKLRQFVKGKKDIKKLDT